MSKAELQSDLRQVIYALSDALDLVGIDDVAHGKRVGIMASERARAMGLDEPDTTFLLGHDPKTFSDQSQRGAVPSR